MTNDDSRGGKNMGLAAENRKKEAKYMLALKKDF